MSLATHAEQVGVRAAAGRVRWRIDRHGRFLRNLIRTLTGRVNENSDRLAELELIVLRGFARHDEMFKEWEATFRRIAEGDD